MLKKTDKKLGLSAFALRVIATLCMLLDHSWATTGGSAMWMTYIGRIAFPIFAFQVAEGYAHTSNFKRYLKRMGFFALIAEIPFNLLLEGSIFYPLHQNVMVTFLISLLVLRCYDGLLGDGDKKQRLKYAAALIGLMLLSIVSFCDYGIRGVLTVFLFYAVRESSLKAPLEAIFMAFLFVIGFKGMQIPVTLFGLTFLFPKQGFCLLALPFIWAYNGEKGYSSKFTRLFSYWFYPAHMLVLWLAGYIAAVL